MGRINWETKLVREAFEFVDELGPEKILELYDPTTSLNAILVVDNVAAGPAIGGLRMAIDVTKEECARLARAMTLKRSSSACRPTPVRSR